MDDDRKEARKNWPWGCCTMEEKEEQERQRYSAMSVEDREEHIDQFRKAYPNHKVDEARVRRAYGVGRDTPRRHGITW